MALMASEQLSNVKRTLRSPDADIVDIAERLYEYFRHVVSPDITVADAIKMMRMCGKVEGDLTPTEALARNVPASLEMSPALIAHYLPVAMHSEEAKKAIKQGLLSEEQALWLAYYREHPRYAEVLEACMQRNLDRDTDPWSIKQICKEFNGSGPDQDNTMKERRNRHPYPVPKTPLAGGNVAITSTWEE